MTTIRERSTAALAKALEAEVTRVARDLTEKWPPAYRTFEVEAERILAASPTIARRLDFATAWDDAEAELPEEWMLQVGHTLYEPERGYGAIAHRRDHGHPDPRDGEAILFRPDPADFVGAYGPTPTDALVALTDALRERAR